MIDEFAEQDAYRFGGTAGDVVVITVAAEPFSSVVAELFGPSGSSIAVSTGGRIGAVSLPQSGTYTVLVRSSNPSAAGFSYGISLQFTRGECGGIISCGQTVSGRIDQFAEQDPYRFNGAAGDVVVITTAAEPFSAVVAELFGPSGESIALTNGGRIGAFTLPATGTYTVLVRSNNPSAADFSYGISLQFTRGECGRTMSCGQTTGGTIDQFAEQDPYRFNASAGDVVLISAAAEPFSGVVAEVFAPSGISVAVTTGGKIGPVALDQTGVYTILVRSSNPAAAGFSYGLSLQFTRGGCGTALACGQSTSGSIEAFAERDAYSFSGTAGDVVEITAAAEPFSGVVAELFGPAGSSLAVNSGTTIGPTTLPQAGTYTVLVGSSNPSAAGFTYGITRTCIVGGT